MPSTFLHPSPGIKHYSVVYIHEFPSLPHTHTYHFFYSSIPPGTLYPSPARCPLLASHYPQGCQPAPAGFHCQMLCRLLFSCALVSWVWEPSMELRPYSPRVEGTFAAELSFQILSHRWVQGPALSVYALLSSLYGASQVNPWL